MIGGGRGECRMKGIDIGWLVVLCVVRGERRLFQVLSYRLDIEGGSRTSGSPLEQSRSTWYIDARLLLKVERME